MKASSDKPSNESRLFSSVLSEEVHLGSYCNLSGQIWLAVMQCVMDDLLLQCMLQFIPLMCVQGQRQYM